MIHRIALCELGYAAIQKNIFWLKCKTFDLINLVTQIHILHCIYLFQFYLYLFNNREIIYIEMQS